jgi:hypothetical protein
MFTQKSTASHQDGSLMYRRYWVLKDPKQWPGTLSLEAKLSGKFSPVAALKLGEELPKDLPVGELTYLGPAREQSEHFKKLKNHGTFDGFTPAVELAGKRGWDRDEWEYRFQWVAKANQRGSTSTMTPTESEFFAYTSIKPQHLAGVLISRRVRTTQPAAPLQFKPMKQNWEDRSKAERFAVTPVSVFDQPRRVTLSVQGQGGPCLLDLDHSKAHEMPAGLTGVETAQLLEELQIDMRFLMNQTPRAQLRMVGCVAYPLPAEYWEATPAKCIAYFDDNKTDLIYQLPDRFSPRGIPLRKDTAYLVTTSDGGMSLFRIEGYSNGLEGLPGKIVLSIRPCK